MPCYGVSRRGNGGAAETARQVGLVHPSHRFIRALKGRLGNYARPEGRSEPFRARAFAESAVQPTDLCIDLPQIRPTMPQKRPK